MNVNLCIALNTVNNCKQFYIILCLCIRYFRPNIKLTLLRDIMLRSVSVLVTFCSQINSSLIFLFAQLLRTVQMHFFFCKRRKFSRKNLHAHKVTYRDFGVCLAGPVCLCFPNVFQSYRRLQIDYNLHSISSEITAFSCLPRFGLLSTCCSTCVRLRPPDVSS